MVNYFRFLSIKTKLLALLLLASLTSVAVLGYLGYKSGRDILTQSIFDQLDSVRATKKQQIEWYFENIRRSVRSLGQDDNLVEGLVKFTKGFNKLGEAAPSREQRLSLEGFYNKEYLPRLKATTSSSSLPAVYWPRSWAAQKLQALYISQNKQDVGQKDKMSKIPEQYDYGNVHEKWHARLRNIVRQYDFYDLFLIDAQTGAIVYSVFKETDFATSLKIGPYANSNLADLFRKISGTHFPGQVKIVDFEFYKPSYNAPASFVGTPLYDNGKFVGVLAAQLSTSALSRFLTGGDSWQREGLGKTGEVYFVGPDHLMRSQSRYFLKDKKDFFQKMKATAVPARDIAQMKALGTTILTQRVETRSVNEALLGHMGTRGLRNYLGQQVLSSYSPTDTGGLRWVIVAEKAVSEAMLPVKNFERNVLVAACLLALLTIMIAMLMASSFLKPVSDLLGGIARLKGGDVNVKLEKTANDEFGQLTDAFNEMVGEISSRDKLIVSKTNAYAALLHRLFPEAVAERLREGEGQFVEKVPSVSVIYVILNGFTQATEALDPDEERVFLNDLQDAFDLAGEKLGMEQVKTIGEHYMAACGLSTPRLDHASRTVKFVQQLHKEVKRLNKTYNMKLSLRAGVHSGEVHVGLVGKRRIIYDIWGTTVNIASRIVYEAEPGTVRVTDETFKVLNKTEGFSPKGTIKTKDLGELKIYQLELDFSAGSEASQKAAPVKTNAAE